MPNSNHSPSRRQFLQGLQRVIGTSAATALLAGNSMSVALAFQADSASYKTKIFSTVQMQILKALCNIVLPPTDTPGAADVNTHGFIDNQLYHCHSKEHQDLAKRVLGMLQKANFLTSSPQQQIRLVEQLDAGEGPFDRSQRSQFKFMKYMICFGYYTSEVGASKELRYVPVPGGYKGSVPLKADDTSWGSKGLFY